MNEIKSKVQITSGAQMKMYIHIGICFIGCFMLPSMLTIALWNIIRGFLPGMSAGVSSAILTVLGIVMVGVGAISVFITYRYDKIRLYTYSYLERIDDEISKSTPFKENGREYVTCPRCGSKMQVNKQTFDVMQQAGERITENSQGAVISREPIYKAAKGMKISYHCCSASCALDVHGGLPSWSSAPCTVPRARLLILGEKPQGSKGLGAKEFQISPLFLFYTALFAVCIVIGSVQFNNYENTKYGMYTKGASEISADQVISFLDTVDTSGEHLITLEGEPNGMFDYIFLTGSGTKDELRYDADTGNWINGDKYYIDGILYSVSYDNTNRKYNIVSHDTISGKADADRRDAIVKSALVSSVLSKDKIDALKHTLSENDCDELRLLKKDNMTIINYTVYLDSQFDGDYYYIFEGNRLICTRAKIDNTYYKATYTYQEIGDITLPE